ncbi:hypothetical protein SAMN02746089_02660 [Caldanaerobius fijiensis DSM 17918]|uniref:Uncharacterized protein n=1 Tax=Caldanaerobius fijiensis DSM 17918 TaxID=1121256 RepID=A0A1M5F0E5_9THEO|nr:hypothetical protein [Caldanaerobius fijiensis]SHF85010.1 hypothetical protein SAMN02746089_02660 [Caldanaerobius fijiensis DSM 17918]
MLNPLEWLLDGHDIIMAMVQKAKEGDVEAARLVLEFMGWLKPVERREVDDYAQDKEELN